MLSPQHLDELCEKFFKDCAYGRDDETIFIDGHVSIKSILQAADFIREMIKVESQQRGELDSLEKQAIEEYRSNHKLDAIRILRCAWSMSLKEADDWLRAHV